MRRAVKSLCIMVVLIFVASFVLTGCGSTGAGGTASTAAPAVTTASPGSTAAPANANAIDTSKEVKLVGYLLGVAPQGMPDVMTEFNKKLKNDINATMEINYIDWGDLDAKYPLVLAAGENIDWIYTADWCKYQSEAAKGAFYELTPDLLNKYMPKHMAATDPKAWQQAKLNGKIYMIPTSTPDRKGYGIAIRGDLADKYGVPAINRVTDLEPYLAAIKQNEPSMIPINMDNTFDINTLAASYLIDEADGCYNDVVPVTGGGTLVFREFDGTSDPAKIITAFDEPLSTQIVNASKLMKDWYDKGYINKNVYANKTRSKDSFQQGKSAVAIGNTTDLEANMEAGAKNGWDVRVILANDKNGHMFMNSFLNNGVAVAASSKNPERTLMALDLMMEDKDYDTLLYYGVKDKHYVLDANGKADYPAGVSADASPYKVDASGFWFLNKDIIPPRAGWTQGYIDLLKNLKDNVLIPDPYIGFAVATDNIKSEVANVQNVYKQYANPIFIGDVKDVDAAFKTLKGKMDAAGIQKIKDEAQKQLDAYIAAQG